MTAGRGTARIVHHARCLSIARRSRPNGGVHALNIEATKLVLAEHDHHRATVAGESAGLHHREELRLFLAVMAVIGKAAKELDGLLCRCRVQLVLGRALRQDLFQAVKHLFDDPVLAHQDVRGLHLRPPFDDTGGPHRRARLHGLPLPRA